MSRHVISCHVTATSCELQPCRSSKYPKVELQAFYSHLQVNAGQMTSLPGHFRSVKSRDIFSCHVTAASCELKLCKNYNVTKTRLIGLRQPLPGDFWSNYVTSGSLPVTWRPFLSRDGRLQQVTALLKVKRTQTRLIRLLRPLPGYFRSNDHTSGSLPVTWSHVT